jgi:hypothetical protein
MSRTERSIDEHPVGQVFTTADEASESCFSAMVSPSSDSRRRLDDRRNSATCSTYHHCQQRSGRAPLEVSAVRARRKIAVAHLSIWSSARS